MVSDPSALQPARPRRQRTDQPLDRGPGHRHHHRDRSRARCPTHQPHSRPALPRPRRPLAPLPHLRHVEDHRADPFRGELVRSRTARTRQLRRIDPRRLGPTMAHRAPRPTRRMVLPTRECRPTTTILRSLPKMTRQRLDRDTPRRHARPRYGRSIPEQDVGQLASARHQLDRTASAPANIPSPPTRPATPRRSVSPPMETVSRSPLRPRPVTPTSSVR